VVQSEEAEYSHNIAECITATSSIGWTQHPSSCTARHLHCYSRFLSCFVINWINRMCTHRL